MESKMVENFNQWVTAGLRSRQTASLLISSSPTYAGPTVRGVENRLGLKRGDEGIHHQPLALGPRTRGSPENSLSEKIAGEVSRSAASGGFFLLPFHCLHGRIWSHCLHAVFMWQLAHIIWWKCELQLQKHPSLCSVNTIHWCQNIFKLTQMRKKKILYRWILHLWACRGGAHTFYPVKKRK